MSNSNSLITKVLTSSLYRVMAAWFGVYIFDKIKAATDYIIGRAGFVYVKTEENAQTILDFFNTHDLYVGDAVYRYIGQVEAGPVAGYTHKFGLLAADLTVSTDDVVYGNRRDYDDLQEGDKVYNGQAAELKVTQTELPTEGYVNLTGFTDPLHVITGTQYGN